MNPLLMVVPWWGRLLAVLALVAAVWGHGWVTGRGQVREQWDAAVAKLEQERINAVVAASKVGSQVVTHYVDRVRVVREHAVAVGNAADRLAGDCPLSAEFRRLHDAAASGGAVPAAAGGPDAAAGAVAVPAVVRTVAGNYATCHDVAARLEALQQYIRQVSGDGSEPGHP